MTKGKMIEAKKTIEQYSLKYQDSLNKRVPSTFTKVFPLNSQSKPEIVPVKIPDPQPFKMATPPGLEVPLRDLGFPLPDFPPISRKEERTIAKKNHI